MKRKGEQDLVKNLMPNQQLNAVLFAVAKIEAKTASNGNPFISLSLGDKTGYCSSNFWVRNETEQKQTVESVKNGDVVEINGQVKEWKGRLTINIESKNGGKLAVVEKDEYAIEDFKEKTTHDVDKSLGELVSRINLISNPSLKILCDHFLQNDEFLELFKESPGAKTHHHNYIGGLLMHTLEVIKICEVVATFHKELDKDLLFAGAFLHDVGKIQSYSYEGAAIVLTSKDNLIGHLPLGALTVTEAITKLRADGKDFPVELENKLLHLILSHHGEIDLAYGSPVNPQIPEAVVLFHADNLDAQSDGAVAKVRK